MSRSPDNEDGCFVAMDTEDDGADPAGITEEEVVAKMGTCRQDGSSMDSGAKGGGGRTMLELPEEVLEYILSFLSPYQEHKTAALVCKQWYRLIKGRLSYLHSIILKAIRRWAGYSGCEWALWVAFTFTPERETLKSNAYLNALFFGVCSCVLQIFYPN